MQAQLQRLEATRLAHEIEVARLMQWVAALKTVHHELPDAITAKERAA